MIYMVYSLILGLARSPPPSPCVIEGVKPATPWGNYAHVGERYHGNKYQSSAQDDCRVEYPPELHSSQVAMEILDSTVCIEQYKHTYKIERGKGGEGERGEQRGGSERGSE